MTAHAAIAAVPKSGMPNRTLLQALLVSRVAWIVGAGEDPTAFDPRGEDDSPLTQVIGYNGLWFWYDEADSTTGHDGTTCIVTTATGGRYKVTGVDMLITHVISKTLADPPDPDDVDEELRPSDGDAYLVPTGGTWPSGKEDYIAVWVEARREWFYIAPKAGWFVWVPGATQDTAYHYDSVQTEWIVGLGAGAATTDSVPLSAIIGCAASLTVRVENQKTYAPPGSRKTGATPTMPLGGTASNINDNSDTTLGVTSALGDLTGGSVASRIIARLALASTATLICIEARGVLGSAVSSSNAMGLYYSTNNGSTWTQAGSGFTLSATAQTIQRTGTFVGVTDIALVTEAKNWSTATNTVAGLNAFDATVTGSVGDSYVVASPAIGVFAGMENKVAICEVANAYVIYTPSAGDEVYDKALATRIRWTGSAWQAAVSGYASVIEAEDLTTLSLSNNSSDQQGYVLSSTPPTSTQSDDNFADTLTCSVTADVAGQVVEVEYDASVLTALAATTPGSATTQYSIVAAFYVDSETNARYWQRIFLRKQASGAADATIWAQFHPRCAGKITLGDTSAHTIKVRFHMAIVDGGNTAITANSISLMHRRIIARKRAA